MIDDLLCKLEGVRQTAPDKWISRCHAHDDRRASCAIREQADGRVLVYCFAGCTAESVLGAIGLDFSVLFPDRPKGGLFVRNARRPFNPMDVLRCLSFEATVVYVACREILNDTPLTDADRERLLIACERLGKGVEVANG